MFHASQAAMAGMGNKDSYIGNEVYSYTDYREMLSLTYPVQNGLITNWDAMEKFWHYTFHTEMGIVPEEHPVLLADSPINTKSHREKTTQVSRKS